MRIKLRSIVLGLLLAGTLPGCREPVPPKPIRPVRVMIVGDTATFGKGTIPGRAKATQEVNLSFRVSGPLIELAIDVGTVVKQDDVIARIDPKDFQVALESAQAALEKSQANLDAMREGARPEEMEQLKAAVSRAQAEYGRALAEYQRAAQLVKDKVVSASEFDRKRQVALKAQADLRTAQEDLRIGEVGARKEDIQAQEAEIRDLQAAVEGATDQLRYTELKAPFSGVVSSKYVDNFETVHANQQIVRLLDISKIEMVVHLPERAMPNLKYVRDIKCRFDQFRNIEIPAEIKEIGHEASKTTRTYPVTLIMDQPDAQNVTILPGMAGEAWGRANLPDDAARRGVEVLTGAVFTPETEKQNHVWIVDPQTRTVRRQAVTVGELTETGIHVQTGLKPGDMIVTAGVYSLHEGQQVRLPEAVVPETESPMEPESSTQPESPTPEVEGAIDS